MTTKKSSANFKRPNSNSLSLNSSGLCSDSETLIVEKRKNARRCAAMNISCCGAQTRSFTDACLLVNISKGGAAVESKKSYRAGERITLDFPVPQGGTISVLSEIIHSMRGGFGTLYGFKYVESDLGVISELNAYLLKYFNLY